MNEYEKKELLIYIMGDKKVNLSNITNPVTHLKAVIESVSDWMDSKDFTLTHGE